MGYGNGIWTVLPLSHAENIVECLPEKVNPAWLDALSYYNIKRKSKMVIMA